MVVLSLALVGSLSQSCDKMQVSVWLASSLSIPAEILYTGSSVSGLSLWELRQPPGSALSSHSGALKTVCCPLCSPRGSLCVLDDIKGERTWGSESPLSCSHTGSPILPYFTITSWYFFFLSKEGSGGWLFIQKAPGLQAAKGSCHCEGC